MSTPFTYRLRVRYHECDGQKVVFNARYGEYADVAALEFARAVFGSVDAKSGGIDWRLIKQESEWTAPAHFDDVLEVQVRTLRLGTTSFTLQAEIFKLKGEEPICRVTTVYVVFDEALDRKQAIPDSHRAILEAGMPGRVVDCSGNTL